MSKLFDGEALGKQLVLVVRDYVGRATAALTDRVGLLDHRLTALESRLDKQQAELEERLTDLTGGRSE